MNRLYLVPGKSTDSRNKQNRLLLPGELDETLPHNIKRTVNFLCDKVIAFHLQIEQAIGRKLEYAS
jgi:hypothetical protein